MKGIKLIIFLVLVIFICTSCGGGGNPPPGDSDGHGGSDASAIASLDLKNASSLAIVPTSAIPQSSTIMNSSAARIRAQDIGSENTLVKITDGGAIQIVDSYDAQGNLVRSESLNPTNIYDVDDKYLIVVFNYRDGYLVQKETGSVYSLSNVGYPSGYNYYFRNVPEVFTDDFGNLFYLANSQVKKINVQDPNHLTAETVSQFVDSVNSFTGDSAGNIFYSGFNWNGTIISAATGTAKSISDVMCYWKAPDDNFYYISNNNISHESGGYLIQKVTINGSNITYASSGSEIGSLQQGVSYLFKTNNRMIIIDDRGNISEVYPNPKTISLSNTVSSVETAVSTNDYYYIAGLVNSTEGEINCLLKVNSTTDACQILCKNYRIYKMVVSNDNKVTFNALDMNNSQIVFGTIDENNVPKIFNREINEKVVELIKIN